jgi:hypothetical protein
VTRFALRLPQRQARIVALAVSYHLSRPGAELDPGTMAEYEHGLAEVMLEIEPQTGAEHAVIELNPLQAVLLSAALSSIISELKMYSLFDTMSGTSARPRSTAPGFDDRVRSLFPEVAGDPSAASEIAEDATMLRRELPSARARQALQEQRDAAARARPRRKRWQFWKR